MPGGAGDAEGGRRDAGALGDRYRRRPAVQLGQVGRRPAAAAARPPRPARRRRSAPRAARPSAARRPRPRRASRQATRSGTGTSCPVNGVRTVRRADTAASRRRSAAVGGAAEARQPRHERRCRSSSGHGSTRTSQSRVDSFSRSRKTAAPRPRCAWRAAGSATGSSRDRSSSTSTWCGPTRNDPRLRVVQRRRQPGNVQPAPWRSGRRSAIPAWFCCSLTVPPCPGLADAAARRRFTAATAATSSRTAARRPGRPGRRSGAADGQMSQRFCWTIGWRFHQRPSPKVSPACTSARAIMTSAPMMWSSRSGLVSGGSATVHIRT